MSALAEHRVRLGRVKTKTPDNVVIFDAYTRLDLPPSRVLAGALEAGLSDVIIIGRDADGDGYYAASMVDGGDMLWLVEKFKMRILG